MISIQAHIILLKDKEYASRLEGTLFSSKEELTGTLAVDGVDYESIDSIEEFMQNWNDSEKPTYITQGGRFFITYIYIPV